MKFAMCAFCGDLIYAADRQHVYVEASIACRGSRGADVYVFRVSSHDVEAQSLEGIMVVEQKRHEP